MPDAITVQSSSGTALPVARISDLVQATQANDSDRLEASQVDSGVSSGWSSRSITLTQVRALLGSGTGAYAPINSPNFTGTPLTPDANVGSPGGMIANKNYVTTQVTGLAPLSSPSFTNTPTAPTPSPLSDNSTRICTTAFAQSLVGSVSGSFLPINNPTYTGTLSGSAASLSGQINSTYSGTNQINNLWLTADGTVARLRNNVGGASSTLALGIGGTDIAGISTAGFGPAQDNMFALGSTALRWSNIRAVNSQLDGTITARSATAIAAGGTSGLLLSNTANFGLYFGSGAPTSSAAQGSLYLRSDGTPYYNTNGSTAWAPIGGSVSIGDTPPSSPQAGNLWWKSDTGVLYIFYNDGNSSQWVPATPTPAPTGPTVQLVGETVTVAGATDMRVTWPSNARKVEIEYLMETSDASSQSAYVQWMVGGVPNTTASYSYTYVFSNGTSATPSAGGANSVAYSSIGTAIWHKGVLRPIAPGIAVPTGANMVYEGTAYLQGAAGLRIAIALAGDGPVPANTINGARIGFVAGTTLAANSSIRAYAVV